MCIRPLPHSPSLSEGRFCYFPHFRDKEPKTPKCQSVAQGPWLLGGRAWVRIQSPVTHIAYSMGTSGVPNMLGTAYFQKLLCLLCGFKIDTRFFYRGFRCRPRWLLKCWLHGNISRFTFSKGIGRGHTASITRGNPEVPGSARMVDFQLGRGGRASVPGTHCPHPRDLSPTAWAASFHNKHFLTYSLLSWNERIDNVTYLHP